MLVRCLVAAGLMFAAALSPLLIMILPPVAAVLADPGRPVEAVSLQLLAWCLAPVVVLLGVGLLCRHDRIGRPGARLAAIGLRFDARPLLIGVAVLVCSILLVPLIMLVAAALGVPTGATEFDTGGLPVGLVIIQAVGLALVYQSFGEEVIWRGWLQHSVPVGPYAAIMVSTVGFTVLHLVSQGGQQSPVEHLLYLALPFGMGFSAAVLVGRTGSLWAGVGIHAGIHLGNSVVTHLLPGAPQGPSAWLLVGTVFTAVGVVGLCWPRASGGRVADASSVATPVRGAR